MVAAALRHARLLRQQRGEILISDRGRHQRQEERTEPEGRRRSAHRPYTRRSHLPRTPTPATQRARSYRNTAGVARKRRVYLLSGYRCEGVKCRGAACGCNTAEAL